MGATRRSWAAANSGKLTGFIRGYRLGLDWLFEAANKPEAGMSSWARVASARTAAIDLDGVRTVLALRSQYARPQKALTDPARYVDLTYYERASGSR